MKVSFVLCKCRQKSNFGLFLSLFLLCQVLISCSPPGESFVSLDVLKDWKIPLRVSDSGQVYVLNTPVSLNGPVRNQNGELMISTRALKSWLGVSVSPEDGKAEIPCARDLADRAKRIGYKQEIAEAPFLMAVLYYPELTVRTEALLAIRRMRNPVFDEVIFDKCLEYYSSKSWPKYLMTKANIRGASVYKSTLSWALTAIGRRSLPRIQSILDRGCKSDQLREKFAWTIGHLISNGRLVVKEDPKAVELLRRLLKDDSEVVRVRAAGSLGRAGLIDGYEAAKAGLESEEGYTRMASAWALGFIGIEDGLKKAAAVAMDGARDSDLPVRYEAIHAIGNIAQKTKDLDLKRRVVEQVIPLLSSPFTGDRIKAVVVVWKADYKPAADKLAELLLQDSDFRLRRQAARGLAKLSVPSTIPSLLKALDDPHPEVRKWVLNAFRNLEMDEATKAKLRERLAVEPDNRTRMILKVLLKTRK